MQGGQDKSLGRCDGEIFVVSALILYVELVLIRWIGTEIIVFTYLGNLLLVVCFFGVGLGCYRAERPILFDRLGLNLLLLAVLVANPLHRAWLDLYPVTPWLRAIEDSSLAELLLPSRKTGLMVCGLMVMGVLLYLLVHAFVPLGQMIGRAFQRHPRVVRAYSMNIGGSLAGTWLFNALAWASLPPVVWFTTAAGLLALAVGVAAPMQRRAWLAVAGAAIACWMVWLGREATMRTIWTPYQNIFMFPFYAKEGTNSVLQGYEVGVNGILYQSMLNLSDEFMRAHPEVFDLETAKYGHYNLPFCFKPSVRRMLIVGAGTGNNAAAALRHGVEQIDCVEIDPQIYALGKQLHPEGPYDSPCVHMIVNDARAFFHQAAGPYDVIWFGLLDSYGLGSSYNNLRLDHYVYTMESLQEARKLLARDGLIIMNFATSSPVLADRLAGQLKQIFGREPLAYWAGYLPNYGGWGGVTVISGPKPVTPASISDRSQQDFVQSHRLTLPGTTQPTTDDWPYLYLRRPGIPPLHLLTSLAVLGTVGVAGRRAFGLRSRLDWHFFSLGAAFLLLEVQTVSRATLLFGMTWVVNAIVISAVLVMILLSNLVAARCPRFPQWLIVAGLALTVVALAFVPLDAFNALTGATKVVVASAFLTAPVFFAGLIFIRSFAVGGDKARALGSNLIGALVGGLLESLSFVTGMRALVLLVGLFYALALWCRPNARSLNA